MAANDNELLARLNALEQERDQLKAAATAADQRAKAAEAKAAEQAAKAEAIDATEKARAISDGEQSGRITPVNKAQIEKYATHVDAAGLRAFIDTLPVQTRSNPIGANQSNNVSPTNAEASDARLMNLFGVSVADVAKFGDSGPVSLAEFARKRN